MILRVNHYSPQGGMWVIRYIEKQQQVITVTLTFYISPCGKNGNFVGKTCEQFYSSTMISSMILLMHLKYMIFEDVLASIGSFAICNTTCRNHTT